MCAGFKVDRSPVREALQMLADRRLVAKPPRQGYVVRQLNLTEIHELYELRLVLETYIMEQVSARRVSTSPSWPRSSGAGPRSTTLYPR